jgi:hypothetical protein
MYVLAGSSLSVGFGTRCAPLGAGRCAAAQPPAEDVEDVDPEVSAPVALPREACAVAALRPPLVLDPHAASKSPAVAVSEQHSSLCMAREGADIRAA